MIGGVHRDKVEVYGYGMMLRPENINSLKSRFKEESAEIKEMGFKALKMKVGVGPKDDIKLIEAVRRTRYFRFMVDANHGYNT